MKSARVCYISSQYQSHLRVAEAYRAILRSRYAMVPLADANVVILHHDPREFASWASGFPGIPGKYLIGYCVWEATELPETFRRSIAPLQEIWTCSRYCATVFRKVHPRVYEIPHVIERDMACSDADRAWVRQVVGYDPEAVYYLSITKLWDKRKNTACLIDAFLSRCGEMPRARLVLKIGPRDPVPDNADGRLIYVSHLTSARLNALYEVADVYVSAHHAEGWGLPLSDAMLFGKPVVATGYSGNLEFMTPENSLLLPCRERHIAPGDCFGMFNRRMKWAYLAPRDVAGKLVLVYRNLHSTSLSAMAVRAQNDVARFNRDAVAKLLFDRIDTIARTEL